MERYDLEEFRKELRIPKEIVKRILWGVGAILGLVLLWETVGTVGAGERGVLLRFGAVTGTIFEEGLNLLEHFQQIEFVPMLDQLPILQAP